MTRRAEPGSQEQQALGVCRGVGFGWDESAMLAGCAGGDVQEPVTIGSRGWAGVGCAQALFGSSPMNKRNGRTGQWSHQTPVQAPQGLHQPGGNGENRPLVPGVPCQVEAALVPAPCLTLGWEAVPPEGALSLKDEGT